MKIIDTHTHLNDERYASDLSEVIKKAREIGVEGVINSADTLESFDKIVKLTLDYPDFCYGSLGVHPNEVKGSSDLEVLRKYLETRNERIVAVGEIGLDFHYEPTNDEKDLQLLMFVAQMDIAIEHALPIVVHSRDADNLTYSLISQKKPNVPVVLHCYSGSKEMAKRYIQDGIDIYFGIGGVVTFKNSRRLVEVVESVPLERLLLETDAPYLAPTPHRGERNEPSYLDLVVAKIAQIKGLDEEVVAKTIYENTRKVFKL